MEDRGQTDGHGAAHAREAALTRPGADAPASVRGPVRTRSVDANVLRVGDDARLSASQTDVPRARGGERRLARRALRAGVVIGAVAAMALVAAACGGGSSSKTPKASATAKATQTPVHAGIVTPLPFTPGANLTDQDLEARGHGQPGRGEFDGEKLIIPSINVDAPFSPKTVPGPPNGQMPNPNSWNDVVYYDFSNWPGLGGVPGKGGNIVLAGHVDYIHHGPAVFWDLRKLQPGDKVEIQMKDGTVATYEVVFNKFVDADTADFNKITAATAQESVTLVTCTGDFNNGHYNERQIVWAKRV